MQIRGGAELCAKPGKNQMPKAAGCASLSAETNFDKLA
jgi:hypothetical protein